MKNKTLAIIAIILIIGIAGTFYYLYSFSGNKADVKFIDLTLEASDSQAFLSDLLTYKKFKFTLTYDLLGGYVPVTCKDFVLNVKIEDLYVGSVQIGDFQISGWWSRHTETGLLDLSQLSTNDLNYIKSQFSRYGRELKVEVESSATIDAIVTSKVTMQSLTKYFLLGSPSIDLVDVYWGTTSARAGDSVDFHVIVSSPYRVSQLSGNLAVVVREDIILTQDRDVKTYSFSVSLASGQSYDYTQSFQVYKNFLSTRGFFLKVYWEGTQIYEMGEGYPPRLSAS